jgi:hypothetical protein
MTAIRPFETVSIEPENLRIGMSINGGDLEVPSTDYAAEVLAISYDADCGEYVVEIEYPDGDTDEWVFFADETIPVLRRSLLEHEGGI